jgi:hypothetical protein
MKHYKAPWCVLLTVFSAVLTVFFLGLPFGLWFGLRSHGVPLWTDLWPLVFVLGAALFTIRGYTVTDDAILVRRLFWATRLPRAGLQSVRFQPNAMRWSLRTFGNGGFFSISGFYWSKPLGAYRAFVTDPRRTVVMRYARRTVVVSPDAPEELVCQLAVAGPADARGCNG